MSRAFSISDSIISRILTENIDCEKARCTLQINEKKERKKKTAAPAKKRIDENYDNNNNNNDFHVIPFEAFVRNLLSVTISTYKI